MCVAVPVLLTPLPFITKSYGKSKGWCWIKQEESIDQFWMALEFYLPFLIVLFINLYFYYKIYQKIWYGGSTNTESKIMKKLVNRLKYYPLSMVVCFGIAFVHRVYYMFNTDTNYYLDLTAGCTVAIYGFINAITYGFTRSVRKSIKRTFVNLLLPSDNSAKNDSTENFLK